MTVGRCHGINREVMVGKSNIRRTLGTGAPRGGVARATAPGARAPRLQSEVKATDNTRLIDD